jgi:hypothetical protein
MMAIEMTLIRVGIALNALIALSKYLIRRIQ